MPTRIQPFSPEVEGVRVQVAINPRFVPAGFEAKSFETLPMREVRKFKSMVSGGELCISPTPNVSLSNLFAQLTNQCRLTKVTIEDRADQHQKRSSGHYVMIGFIFHHKMFVVAPDAETERVIRLRYQPFLEWLLTASYWEARAYLNPLQRDESAERKYGVSINLNGRTPRYDSKGIPIVAWRRDEFKNKIGDKALPIRPDWSLEILDTYLSLVKA